MFGCRRVCHRRLQSSAFCFRRMQRVLPCAPAGSAMREPTLRRPCFLKGAGAPFRPPRFAGTSFPSGKARGMERREAQHQSAPFGAARFCESAHASQRSIAAICVLGTVLPGSDGGLFGPLIPRASARVRPSRVQPSKAAPRSWSGRLPEASRSRACEARPRAPHPVPLK
jgi:hypothetical protein